MVRAARSGRRGASHCARPAGLALPTTPPQCVERTLCARRSARFLDFSPTTSWPPPPIFPNVGEDEASPARRPSSQNLWLRHHHF